MKYDDQLQSRWQKYSLEHKYANLEVCDMLNIHLNIHFLSQPKAKFNCLDIFHMETLFYPKEMIQN